MRKNVLLKDGNDTILPITTLDNVTGGYTWTNVEVRDFNDNLVTLLKIPNDVETFGELLEATAQDINCGFTELPEIPSYGESANGFGYYNSYLAGFSTSGLMRALFVTTRIDSIDLSHGVKYFDPYQE